jgi:SAM-dependent methyltransferase
VNSERGNFVRTKQSDRKQAGNGRGFNSGRPEARTPIAHDGAAGGTATPLKYEALRYLQYDNGPPEDEAKKHLELRHVRAQLLAYGLYRGRALDIGTASGRYARMLADVGFQVLGVDSNPTAIDLCRGSSNHTGSASFRVADFLRDPITGPFDLIVSGMGTFNHITKDLHPWFLERAASFLSPGGLLLFSSWNPESRHTQYLQFYNRTERERLRSNSRPGMDTQMLLDRVGLSSSKVIPFCFLWDANLHEWQLPPDDLVRFDADLADVLQPSEAQMYLVVAEKPR